MKTLLLLALLFTGCERIEKTYEPADWLTVEKTSVFERPDSPEQVCVTLRTSDGKTWDAEWVKR